MSSAKVETSCFLACVFLLWQFSIATCNLYLCFVRKGATDSLAYRFLFFMSVLSPFSHLFTLNDPRLFINIALVLLFFILTTSVSTPYTPLGARIREQLRKESFADTVTHFFLSCYNPNMFIILTVAMH